MFFSLYYGGETLLCSSLVGGVVWAEDRAPVPDTRFVTLALLLCITLTRCFIDFLILKSFQMPGILLIGIGWHGMRYIFERIATLQTSNGYELATTSQPLFELRLTSKPMKIRQLLESVK